MHPPSYHQSDSGDEQDSDTPSPALQKKFQELFNLHPSLTPDQIFYLEASKLLLQNINLSTQVLICQTQIKNQQEAIKKLRKQLGIQIAEKRKQESSSHGIDQNGSDKKKRVRRTAVEIARHYTCNIDKCNKSYGSEGSLNQHMKLKHKIYYARQLLLMNANHLSEQ